MSAPPPAIAADVLHGIATKRLSEVMTALRVPALTGGIITKDGVVTGATIPDSLDCRLPFHIGSVAKSFTALTIDAVCKDEAFFGRLSKTSQLKEFWQGGLLPPTLADATMEELLNHRSGMEDNVLAYGFTRDVWGACKAVGLLARNGLDVWSMAQESWIPYKMIDAPDRRSAFHKAMEIIQEQSGSRMETVMKANKGHWKYSNFGVALAAYMAEAATNEDFAALMDRYVFKALDLPSAGFGEPYSVDASYPVGHRTQGLFPSSMRFNPLPPITSCIPHILIPAGDVHCNVHDLLKFLQFHLNNFETNTPYYTSGFQPLAGSLGANYINGFVVDDTTSHKKATGKPVRETDLPLNFLHDGSTGAWFTYAQFVPEWGLAACIMTNACPYTVHAPVLRGTRDMLLDAAREKGLK